MKKQVMKRVMIVGTAGVGKTTLATLIGGLTGLPVHHLDLLAWTAGWVRRPAKDFERDVDKVLKGERWVVDGNYTKSLPVRAGHADTLILIDLPLWQCLLRVFGRWWQHTDMFGRGKQRPDLPEGCPEPLPWTFLKWVLSAPPRHQSLWLEVAGKNPKMRFIHLTSARQVDEFVQGLRHEK